MSRLPCRIRLSACLLIALVWVLQVPSQAQVNPTNKPERLEWFRDLGLGLFIHWSLDSQLGMVISHSLVGASEDYTKRFFEELPRSFNPTRFDPDEWAKLARLCGFRYVVFTAKHHSGFCMYNTGMTPFSIMNTPYGKDITAQIVRAFRDQGLAIGLYFSPDDFWFLHQQGKLIARRRPGVTPQENPPLMDYDKKQLTELLTQYGPIDILFIDGPAEGLREHAWQLQPNLVITRGALETPEQYIPGVPLEGAWEGNLTIGTQWQWRPTNENYKSGTELIQALIETRAKGGNLLLNIGPRPDGVIPLEQEGRLIELGLWMFINREAIYEVRPWVVTNEGDIWFTRKKGENTIYALVTNTPWKWGERKEFRLRSVKATEKTQVSVLGQNSKVLEYRPEVDPSPRWKQTENGLWVSVVRAQRIYNDRRWPNPVVIKITHVEPALQPPKVETLEAQWDPGEKAVVLRARLVDLGNASSVQVGFEYRRRKGAAELYEPTPPWQPTEFQAVHQPGVVEYRLRGLAPGQTYEYRAVVQHPLITVYGREVPVDVPER